MSIVINSNYFGFSADIKKLVGEFAAIHYNYERKVFKLAWKTWTEFPEIKSQFDAEIKRLADMGCKDDVEDKLFKSARYYYRKKIIRESNTETASTTDTISIAEPIASNIEQDATVKPRIKNEKAFLKQMDEHLWETFKRYTVAKDNKQVCSLAPATAFADFLKTCPAATDAHKKTYKNRFYRIRDKYVAEE